MKIAPIFLKDEVAKGGIALSNENYGLIYGTAGTIAFILGSILSGYYISHFGLKKTLFSLVCIFNIPFAVYLLLAIFQPSTSGGSVRVSSSNTSATALGSSGSRSS